MTKFSWLSLGWQLKLFGSVAIFGTLFAAVGGSVLAQIVPDNTLGAEGSVVTPNVNIQGIPSDRIDAGATRGANLFHSFGEFNVGSGRGAYFANPTGIENILTRVTGSNVSNIFGRLGVLGGANLFLLNPNGIVFGPNASLDIQGSFVATTADGIELGDSGYFSAAEPQTSSLLSVSPGALFFSQGANQPGSIINQGNLATGKNLTLAAGNLDLQGQLLSWGDLTLEAQDTVKVRDSPAIPFIASAGGNLLVQGNQGIDIAALSHPYSGLLAGGNLVLRSDQTVGGDAHFWSGGNFSIERLDGSLGNLYSPHDPIILSNGDVTLGDYQGASLHILAGGSVTLGSVTITGTGDAATTINPTNTNLFNGSRTYADLATVNLTDYKATLNSDGSVRSVDPVLVPITIDGSTQATLDVRAGVDWAGLGGLPTNRFLPGTPPLPIANQMATSANITVNGNIQVTQPAGLVLLTNQFSPNTLPGTISIRGSVTTSTSNTGANGGDIRVYGRGDIAVGNALNHISINSSSYSDSDSANAGNGGMISFATNSGNISLDNSSSNSSSFSYSYSDRNAGNGGGISFATNSGNISLDNSFSDSKSHSSSGSGNAGNGGVISFITNSGNISLDNSFSDSKSDLYSISYSNSDSGNAGNGGAISFATNSGNISLSYSPSDSSSSSDSDLGNAGNGGVISFATNSGNISLDNSSSSSYSSSYSSSDSGNAGNGGVISFATNSGNISLNNSNSSSGSGNGGNGGVISFATNSGNISLNNSNSSSSSYWYSFSGSGNAGNGGVISFATNSGNISLDNSFSDSISFSDSSSGNGGIIHLSARRGTISGSNSVLSSFAVSELGDSGNGGKVTLEAGSGVSGLTINTIASGGNSGDVEINGFGDLRIDETNILTAQQVKVILCENCRSITIPLNDRGQAGNVAVTSTGSLTFRKSVIQSDTRGDNPAGSITIASPGIVSFNNSQIISNTSSTGQAGNITLKAPVVRLAPSSSLSAQTSSSGGAGNLTLQPYDDGQTLSILFQEGAQISASTSNLGIGGNIEIKAPNAITIQGQGTITTETTGTGKAGNITLDTSTLTITRGAQLFALTEGSGNSGTITANASTAVNLGIGVNDFSPVLSVETSNAGQAGSIIINTPTLTLSDTARITATATNTATNTEGSGSITLNASTMDLAGVVGVFAETQGQSPAGTLTLKPYQNQSTLNLTLAPQSQVSASTTGSGKGGNLIVQAPEAITIQGYGQLAVQTTGDGAAGDLRIDTQRLTIADGATISASTSSANPAGIGGNITINATESFNLTNQASLLAQSTGAGRAGDVTINTPQLNLLNEAQVSVETSGAGAAGDVEITTETLTLERGAKVSATATATATTNEPGGSVNVNASQINLSGNTSGLFAQTQSAAPAGSLTLKPFNNGQTLSVNLQDNPQISASTSDSGEGGSLRVTAPEAVTIRGLGQLSVETTGAGKAGGLTIETQKLNISDGATVSASTSSPYASGTGGNLTINATQSFNLTNQARLLAQSNGAAPAGNVAINTEQLTANNGSITTSATARSSGRGGSIEVNASQINLKGTEIGLLAETQGVAPAGSLTLQPFNNGQNLTINLQDNAKISAATSGSGQGGSLSITAPEAITIQGTGQLSVETTGAGEAGNLSIDTQRLTIADGATISASTFSPNPDGFGGNLTINATQSFNLTNQASLLAQSTGAAPAGNITINTGQFTANNGSIETSAIQSAGGGITITASDIRLLGDSDIRTDVASGAGGGGNINLTANTIIAFDDSDILAFARDGKGGDITLKTPIFFGFAYSPAPKGTGPDTLENNNQVDINASGAVSGVITTPDVSFIQNSLAELPDNQINTDSLLANSCIVRRNQPTKGSFTITGTGGLPQRPGDAQMSTFPTVDIETLPSDSTSSNTNPNRPWQKGDPIVEPQGVYRLPNGKLVMSRECPRIQ
ncbi:MULTISPECIES: filamentous hemagglutinin N-terminal domain-containing protein [Cyanophyceae]|uniref:two-partner secretion domain-containing protein n=1 Tax=Cyanophyceae TaxID=3028117 RepID=UPI001682F6D4|nr:filamentous hemagglutinin N-terminal domain-containing protein [Trichocoleus sp. FACHB-69]MBD1933715.1 filamentous hemagglutinin N-terminal domain-containing protein [Trichocoleus sp. FACHB-69]